MHQQSLPYHSPHRIAVASLAVEERFQIESVLNAFRFSQLGKSLYFLYLPVRLVHLTTARFFEV